MNSEQIQFLYSVYYEISRFVPFSEDVCWFIACQFALESNYGKSNLAVSQSNYCGMKRALVRPSLNIGFNEFATYRNLFDCVVDYVLCLTYHKPLASQLSDLNSFKFFISKFYCPEKGYIDKINTIYQQFKSQNYE